MQSESTKSPGRMEFIVLMAALAALDAFSIDAMMPALEQISQDLALKNDNHRQFIITALFLGFSIGVLVYGFAADQFGRRVPVLVGIGVFILASLICIAASSFTHLLIGRTLQGVGAAGPYVLSIAIVRDRYEGREMASIMSLIMMVFIGVPMIAPFIGQLILGIAGWRSIFIALFLYGAAVGCWFFARQGETLASTDRVRLSTTAVRNVFREIIINRQTMIQLINLALISGAFIAYLSTAQQVFQNIYAVGDRFPLAIAVLASAYGLACFVNAKAVGVIGMRRLVKVSLATVVLASLVYGLVLIAREDTPPILIHFLYMGIVIFCFGFLFENVITLSLEPMAHIAGSATAVITAASTGIAILLSTLIGSLLSDSVFPLVAGFACLCGLGLLACLTPEIGEKEATRSHP